jgi:hypothetical protein
MVADGMLQDERYLRLKPNAQQELSAQDISASRAT